MTETNDWGLLSQRMEDELELDPTRQTVLTNDDGVLCITELPSIEMLTLNSARSGDAQCSMINVTGEKNLLILLERVEFLSSVVERRKRMRDGRTFDGREESDVERATLEVLDLRGAEESEEIVILTGKLEEAMGHIKSLVEGINPFAQMERHKYPGKSTPTVADVQLACEVKQYAQDFLGIERT